MATENVGSIEYTVDANVDPLLRANKAADASLDGVSASLDSVSNSSKRLDTQLTKTSKGIKTANAGLSSMRGQLQNTSYQLQDMIVQAQMGTNAFVIMGQQLPQLLGGFGAIGAGLGVFVALGAALGGVIQRTMNAGDETKNYNDEIKLLSQTVKVGENGIVSFSDKFGELASEKPEVAMSKIRLELGRVQSIMNIVSNDTEDLVRGFDVTTYAIQNSNKELKSWTGTAEGLEGIIDDTTWLGAVNRADASRAGVSRLQDTVLELNKGLKLTTADSIGLVRALSNIDTPQGVISAAQYVNELANRLNGASPEVDKLNVRFNEMRVRAENLINSQKALNKALEDTGRIAESTEKQTEIKAEADVRAAAAAISLSEKIAILNTAANEGEEAAVRLAATQAVGADASDALRKTVGDLAVEYYRLTDAQKEAKKEASEQLSIDRQAEALAERVSIQSMSDVDQIKAKAQAQRDLINSSKALTDAQKTQAIANIGQNEQSAIQRAEFGTTDQNQIFLQKTLGITQELAAQLDALDEKFNNIASTIGGTLYDATMQWSDAAGQQMAQNIAQGKDLDDGLRQVASTIATQLLGSLISMGLQYGINAALKTAADTQMASSGVAAIQTQAAAATAAGAEVAAANAPAAAATATWSFGGAAVAGAAALAGIYALSKAGGRLNGGPVSAGSMYEVNENGKPELLTVGNKQMLMMGTQSGSVTSNKDMMSSSGSAAPIVNIYEAPEGTTATAKQDINAKWVIDVWCADMNARGKSHKTTTNTTTAKNKIG